MCPVMGVVFPSLHLSDLASSCGRGQCGTLRCSTDLTLGQKCGMLGPHGSSELRESPPPPPSRSQLVWGGGGERGLSGVLCAVCDLKQRFQLTGALPPGRIGEACHRKGRPPSPASVPDVSQGAHLRLTELDRFRADSPPIPVRRCRNVGSSCQTLYFRFD